MRARLPVGSGLFGWASDGNRRRQERFALKYYPRARTPSQLDAARRRMGRRRAARPKEEWHASIPSTLTRPRPMFLRIHIGWRLASAAIVMFCTWLIMLSVAEVSYYVSSINLRGNALVPGDEIYLAAALDGRNLFWIDPENSEARIRQVPGVKDAKVIVDLPTAVNIEVVEREPVIIWEHGDKQSWVDYQGAMFPISLDLPWLLPVVVDESDIISPAEGNIPPEVVVSALQLKALKPNIKRLHYDPIYGVSYQEGNWRGYFGIGGNMSMKLKVYEALIDDLLAKGVRPRVINVANLDIPYYLE